MMKRKAYEGEMGKLQSELCHLQRRVKEKGLRDTKSIKKRRFVRELY